MDPVIYTPATLAEALAPAQKFANELEEQAGRCIVDSREALDKSADFMKICNSALKRADERRTEQVKPLNDHVKWINDQWRPITATLTKAKDRVQELATAWAKAERDRLQKLQDEERERLEKRAIQEAEEAAAAGNQKLAELIVDAAVATPVQAPVKMKASGGFTGATAALRENWTGSVSPENIRTVCAAIASGVLPADIISFVPSKLNAVASGLKKECLHHGITITDSGKLTAR